MSRKRGVQLEEKGIYHNALLTVATDVLRIVCAASPRIDLQEVPASVPTLGRFVDETGWFVNLISRWLQRQSPSLKRLAFTAKLIRYADSRDELYNVLSRYLHDVDVSPRSSDLLYRINKRRPSATLPGRLEINRLSTWAAMKFTISTQGVLASGETIPAFEPVDRDACVMDLDINTDQEFSGSFELAQLPQLFRELVALGTEIAERGDVE
jgi:hypothetical protein